MQWNAFGLLNFHVFATKKCVDVQMQQTLYAVDYYNCVLVY